MEGKNYYELLGVAPDATEDKIREAYLRLIREYHPDLWKGDPAIAEEESKALNEAHQVLCDPEQRQTYDLSLSANSEENGAELPREEHNRVAEVASHPPSVPHHAYGPQSPPPPIRQPGSKSSPGGKQDYDEVSPHTVKLEGGETVRGIWKALAVPPINAHERAFRLEVHFKGYLMLTTHCLYFLREDLLGDEERVMPNLSVRLEEIDMARFGCSSSDLYVNGIDYRPTHSDVRAVFSIIHSAEKARVGSVASARGPATF